MELSKLYRNYRSRCWSYHARVPLIRSYFNPKDPWRFNHLTQVLISDVWQSWSRFSRELFLASCRGSNARDGSAILSLSGDKSWQRLSYLALQASKQQLAKPNGHINFALWKEPSWGDVDKFLRIVNAVQPANLPTLQAAYGSFTSIKHLQQVRNSCFHKNVESVVGLSRFGSHYGFYNIKCPSEIAWKVSGSTHSFAIEVWINESLLIADMATATN